MFGGSFWGAPIGNDDHLSREREPPPRPTKLEFPAYVPKYRSQVLTRSLSSQLRKTICHGRSFLDAAATDIESLNINFEKDVSISSLLPEDCFSQRPLLYDDDLQAMLDEISIDNEDAFREVLRMAPLSGRKKPRLAYARNFFGSLEDMARYFDGSRDNYYTVPAEGLALGNDSVMESTPANVDRDVEMRDVSAEVATEDEAGSKEFYKGYRISSAESLPPGTRLAMAKNLLKTTMHKFQCRDHEPMPQPREKFTIRGVKIQSIQYQFCVARIPSDLKLARARMVEGPIMAVMVRDELRFKEQVGLEKLERVPFIGERFDFLKEVGCMLILAAQRARQGRTNQGAPVNDEKWWVARQRWGGGPTTWGQLAHEIFEDEDPSWSPEERRLQDEKRHRQAEDKARGMGIFVDPKKLGFEDLMAGGSGSDTTKQSLPGIPAGATSSVPIVSPTDLDTRPRRKKLRSMDRPSGSEAVMRDGKRTMYVPPFKDRWYQEWKKLRPNMSVADDKIIGKKIGAAHGEFDDIYMLTSVNHHVALVKMRVHPDYLSWLENGTEVSEEETEGLKKNVLYVRRTVWFDMFNVKDRQDFLIGLWRVFCWINRDHVPEVEHQKMIQLQVKGQAVE